MPILVSRRRALELIAAATSIVALAPATTGCSSSDETRTPDLPLPSQNPDGEVGDRPAYADAVDALADVLLPADRDARGAVVVPGARECGVDDVLKIEELAALATVHGFVVLSTEDLARIEGASRSLRELANGALDAIASRHRPLARFRDLPRAVQESMVEEALADPAAKPLVLLVRAACFVAFLGGTSSDAGLRALGFPPFEDPEKGIRVSGYPRTKGGRRIDPGKENLAGLAAAGELDDYTFNREPAPTPGDPLATALDANGDLP